MTSHSRKSIAGLLNDMDGAAIKVRQDRCAKVRNRNVECLKCADACTSGCISLVDGKLVVDASKCVGCGTCATVCPTCALEARNPSDAELLHECIQAACNSRLVITCDQVAQALKGIVAEDSLTSVVCLGRVDESLIAQLVARGIEEVLLLCGKCSHCAQAVGLQTAHLIADTVNDLLDAFGSKARASVVAEVPPFCLTEVASAQQANEAIARHFSEKRGATPIRHVTDFKGSNHTNDTARVLSHVMADGTLPHFLPDRRERLLDALVCLGAPVRNTIESRLWGCVVIDGRLCSSCRMCATFCPTGAIRKFDEEDGTFGVLHFPADCVRCGSCCDICPENAISILDAVDASCLVDGERHRYVMKPRAVELDDPHQILNMARLRMEGDVFER